MTRRSRRASSDPQRVGSDQGLTSGAPAWNTYVVDWTRMNHVRAGAAILASLTFVVALVRD